MMWGKTTLHRPLEAMQASATTLENIWRFLKNLNIDLPYDLVIPLLGIYP
jgi:hypothetical protein